VAAGAREPGSVMLAMREVREIYHQGVWAVAAAFRRLYEMIDADEERVQRLVAAATVAHLRKIEQFGGRVARLECRVRACNGSAAVKAVVPVNFSSRRIRAGNR
jgi:hypothetical protein